MLLLLPPVLSSVLRYQGSAAAFFPGVVRVPSYNKDTVRPFIFAAPLFRESVTKDIIPATTFREFQMPVLKLLRIEIFANVPIREIRKNLGPANIKNFTV